MASKKKESEGIALLSMYYDEEDEEMEDAHEDGDVDDREELGHSDRVVSDSAQEPSPPPPLLQSQPSLPIENSSPLKRDRVPTPTPTPPSQFWSNSPPQQVLQPPPEPPPANPDLDSQRTRKQALAIVDYAHDETAMSPEAEEGEITGTGHVMFGEDLRSMIGNSQEKTPNGTVQIVSPNTEPTIPQLSEPPQQSQSDNSPTTNYGKMESETAEIEETIMVSVEIQEDVDPLENFLPPPPKTKCSEELQEKINKFLALKRAGKSFNAEVRNRKDYRNPDFLQHAVRYQDIDQIGSCFNKDVFDPHGYEKSDFYDEIESDMKREMERKEQEKKRSQKVEFVAGGTQPGMMGMPPKTGMQIPVAPTVAASGLHSLPVAADAMPRDSRQNKKSKWDKVDGDRKNPVHAGGQDAVSTAATHAALLSAANAGAGYTAFAQQKRREAEERRSSDKKRS